MMFKTKCANPDCDKTVFTFATSRTGKLPAVYCSDICKGKVINDSKFINPKRIG